MTFHEIVSTARNHMIQIGIMLDKADPDTALSTLFQLAEIEEQLARAIYSDLLAMEDEHDDGTRERNQSNDYLIEPIPF